jgi:hypothetical protein
VKERAKGRRPSGQGEEAEEVRSKGRRDDRIRLFKKRGRKIERGQRIETGEGRREEEKRTGS